MTEEILLVGTGALATLFAARLGAAGQSVHMLGTWKEGLAALNQHGARIVGSDGTEHTVRVRATDDPLEVRGVRHAIVLVKAWQTERAAHQLSQCLADDGIALTIQNGIGNWERLALDLGDSRVCLGSTTTGATLLGPGLVRAGGEGIVSLEQNPALGPVERALRASQFNVHIVDDAQAVVWGKLVINAAINPLSALLKIPNGELLQRPAAREMMAALASEAAQVAKAEGVTLPYDDAVLAAEDVARKTAANFSSMAQDVMRGALTEIDAICGELTQRGERHGVATPNNRACWNLVRALSEDAA